MGLHQVLHDRQAEPGPAFLAGAAGVDAIESLENAREVLGRDARAGVADAQDSVSAHALCDDADFAASRRVSQRIVVQVGEDLPQRFGIAVEGRGIRGGFECDAPARGALGEWGPCFARGPSTLTVRGSGCYPPDSIRERSSRSSTRRCMRRAFSTIVCAKPVAGALDDSAASVSA